MVERFHTSQNRGTFTMQPKRRFHSFSVNKRMNIRSNTKNNYVYLINSECLREAVPGAKAPKDPATSRTAFSNCRQCNGHARAEKGRGKEKEAWQSQSLAGPAGAAEFPVTAGGATSTASAVGWKH